MKVSIKSPRLSIACLLFIILCSLPARAQELSREPQPQEDKQVLLILSSSSEFNMRSIQSDVVGIVTNIAANMGNYRVVDRSDLQKILQEQALQLTGVVDPKDVVELGRLVSAREAMIITALSFNQTKIEKQKEEKDEDDEKNEDDKDKEMSLGEKIILEIVKLFFKALFQSLFSAVTGDDVEYQSTLAVQLKQVDVETGAITESIIISADAKGGNKGKSRKKALDDFRFEATRKLRLLTGSTPQVAVLDEGKIFIPVGMKAGTEIGDYFEIVKPPSELSLGGKSFFLTERRVAFVRVTNLNPDGSITLVVRSWSPLKGEFRALEYQPPRWAFKIGYSFPGSGYRSIDLAGQINPLGRYSFHFGLSILNIEDSFGKRDAGFSSQAGLSVTALNRGRFNFYVVPKAGFALTFRDDDHGDGVSTGVLFMSLGLEAEYALNGWADVTLGVGNRFGGKNDDWNISSNEEDQPTVPAFWTGDAPTVDYSGFFLSLGMRMTWFR